MIHGTHIFKSNPDMLFSGERVKVNFTLFPISRKKLNSTIIVKISRHKP